ncbi:MAG: UbiA prenyltransferase family protein [Candidatus Aenigmarchaeota archaeon]|nr:UbiA prenyltransferase family protein [Candidatus Aenigmarchaeota archaeon]
MRISDFLGFIRFRICIFVTCIGIIGYLLFNPLSTNLFFVTLTCFFAVAGSYAYNNMTDKEEDLINRKELNSFVLDKRSYLVIIVLFSLGFFFSTFLSFYSLIFCLLGIVISFAYSFFKLKKHFLVKNFYTGFGATLVFLLGATYLTSEIIEYYILLSFFIFIGSAISDLRDYDGDAANNIRTLPVYLGYDAGKKIIFVLLSIFSFLILFFSGFIVFLPFTMVMLYFLLKNKPTLAHSCEGCSFIFLVFWLILGV